MDCFTSIGIKYIQSFLYVLIVTASLQYENIYNLKLRDYRLYTLKLIVESCKY